MPFWIDVDIDCHLSHVCFMQTLSNMHEQSQCKDIFTTKEVYKACLSSMMTEALCLHVHIEPSPDSTRHQTTSWSQSVLVLHNETTEVSMPLSGLLFFYIHQKNKLFYNILLSEKRHVNL